MLLTGSYLAAGLTLKRWTTPTFQKRKPSRYDPHLRAGDHCTAEFTVTLVMIPEVRVGSLVGQTVKAVHRAGMRHVSRLQVDSAHTHMAAPLIFFDLLGPFCTELPNLR